MLRDLFLLMALFLALGLTGCGSDKKSSPASTAAAIQPPAPPQVEEQLLCSDSPECVDHCRTLYPWKDPADITAYYNWLGMLYSGAHQQALSENSKLISKYNNCVAAPLN